jgi:tellurite methyltransferase
MCQTILAAMANSPETHFSPLLRAHLGEFNTGSKSEPILDLACGDGRNGLFLVGNDIPVVFADINPRALEQVRATLSTAEYKNKRQRATFWPVDFEQGSPAPLKEKRFGGIVVFRYLHRLLVQDIRNAIIPGGIVVYETFTVEQPQFGRPKNPDFLLRQGELRRYFSDWHILHHFEGVTEPVNSEARQGLAQIVAIKPEQPGENP